jgi:hypothetical protein
MRQKFYRLLERILVWSTLCFLSFTGCAPQRDQAFDPVVTAYIVPLGIHYDEPQNAVVIEWEYLGVEPVARYHFVRRERDGEHFFDWREAPGSTRPSRPQADVWPMLPVLDRELHAGEFYGYDLFTETEMKKPAQEFVGRVQVPGGRLENIVLDAVSGTAQVIWALPSGNLRNFALFRQADGGQLIHIHTTENSADTLFTDAVVEGNKHYRYILRSTLTSGVELESRAFLLEPYLRFNTFSVAQPSDTSVLMKSAVLLGSPLMTLVMNSGEIFLQGIGANGPLTQRHRLPISQAGSLSMPGLSFSDARVGNIGGLVVAYVNPSKMQVELKAFTLDFLGQRAVTEVPWDHASWQVSNAQIPVNICLTPDEYLLVTVGHRLKVFSPDRMEIAEFNLNLSGDVRHLHADKDGVWITLVDDHRLLRCDPVVNAAGIVTAPVWREVNVGSQ